MEMRLLRGADGRSRLTILRADGSAAWQNSQAFFALHDLLHFVVETELGFTSAFFGLIAAGREPDDFGCHQPGEPPLPAEALYAEHIVGVLHHAFSGQPGRSAVDCIRLIRASLAGDGRPMPPGLTEASVERIRRRFADLARQWSNLGVEAPLSLIFPDPPAPSGS